MNRSYGAGYGNTYDRGRSLLPVVIVAAALLAALFLLDPKASFSIGR